MTALAIAEPPVEATTSPATVTGYVEARTAERVLGWAWDPANPAARLCVGLLLDGRIIARTVADQAREDLARNGIGDGGHAFAFVLEGPARAAGVRLEVAVLSGESVLARLPAAGSEAPPPGILQLQRGLASLAAGQRALMRAVQAPQAPTGELAEAIAALGRQQERIEKAVAALEIFVTRLDDRLAALSHEKEGPRTARLPAMVAGLLALAGAGALVWALLPALG